MRGDWHEAVSLLLSHCHSGFLATVGEHGPETSMAPFSVHQGNIVLHLSALARHTKNIINYANVGFMICTSETVDHSPLSLPRLSLQGKIMPVSDEQFKAAKQTYLKRVPDAEPLFSFGDFKLFCIVPSHLQWVGGFGSARKIPVNSWYKFSQGEVD